MNLYSLPWTEITGSLLCALGATLLAARKQSGWILLTAAFGLYAVIFARVHLYANLALQLAFGVLSLAGWAEWLGAARKDHKSPSHLPMKQLNGKAILAGLCWTLPLTLLCVWTLYRFTNDPHPCIDGITSGLGLLAQFWMGRRYRESWLCWLALDTADGLFFLQWGLASTALLYFYLAVLSFYGYWSWGRETV